MKTKEYVVQPGRLVGVAVPLLAVLMTAAVATAQPVSRNSTVISKSNQSTTGTVEVQDLMAERETLDRTVWEPEVEAQRHERRFVELWDNLLIRDDKFDLLASFPFSTLSLGAPGEPEHLDLGIRRTRFGEATRALTPEAWRDLLARFESEGYEVVQTEWHHSRFEPPEGDRTARSVVSAVIHAAREDPPHRVALTTDLEVVWSAEADVVDANDTPIPDSIAVTKLEMLEREAPPVFREVFEETRPTGRILMPLLVYDLDGNGLSDVVLGGLNQVLWNRGPGQFEAGPFLAEKHMLYDAGVLGDFTGDGAVDYIAVDLEQYPLLFEGDATGQFTRPARRISDVKLGQPKSFTAGDMDADGDLDLFIANYKQPYEDGQIPTPYYDANDGHPAALLRNDGDGTFTDVTEASGLGPKRTRRTFSSSFVDIDEDHDLDLLVVSDFAGIDLYENDGRGQFTDVSDQFGDTRHLFGMGHTFADFDLDGDLDFYAIGMSSTTARRLDDMGLGRDDRPEFTARRAAMTYGNRMFLRGGDTYTQAPFSDQMARAGWAWGASSFDFDNDGDQDVFVANGHISGKSTLDYCSTFWRHDLYAGDSQNSTIREDLFALVQIPLQDDQVSWNGYEHKALFMNEGGERFTNVAFVLGVAFEYDGRSVVTDDLDADGLVDLLVIEYHQLDDGGIEYILHMYQNRFTDPGNWVGVRLRELGPGLSPIGTTVRVVTAAGSQMTRLVTGDSYSAQHAATVHFGLGETTQIEAIEVRWPNGVERRIAGPEVNQYITVSPAASSSDDQIQ